MGKIIAVTNQKGGVGKTTTAVNLTAALGAKGKKVLLIDVDPQGNATSGLGINKREIQRSAYDVLLGNAKAREAILSTPFQNVDILPGSMDLAAAEIEMVELPERNLRLKQATIALKGDYDFILIDCPPSLELLTLDALCAADTLLVPVQCEYYALEGLSDLLYTVRLAKRSLNPSLELEGVLLTMYDGRTNLSMQVAEEVKRHFPGKVFASVIPRNVRLSEAPSHGKPVSEYDRLSRGAEAYAAAAKEFLARNQKKK